MLQIEVGVGDLSVRGGSGVSLLANRGSEYEGGGAVDDLVFVECRVPIIPPDGKQQIFATNCF